jgi:hypothetical protein
MGMSLLLTFSGRVMAADEDRKTGGAGLYLRLDMGSNEEDKKLFLANPMIDAVVLMCRWREVEPAKGQFAIKELQAEVKRWGDAGKGVVLSVMPYGQSLDKKNQTVDGAHYVMETPAWLYEEKDVGLLQFVGGGGAKGQKIALPQVWKEGFAEAHLEPMIAALAKAFDGNPTVWSIRIGLGHIGHMTAQASPDGSKVFLEAGWTPEAWSTYCLRVAALYRKYFTKTPLLLIAEKRLLSHKERRHYVPEETVLLQEMAKQGVYIVHLGLVEDLAGIQPIYSDLEGVLPLAKKGSIRLGIGDDWPLWVPPSRRDDPPTRGHDEQFLDRTLPFAFGGVQNLPELPTTILYLQPPELMVADPNNPRKDELGYHPEVYEILKRVREQLKQKDKALFGH